MPTYQYRCKQCSTELEAVQKFTDDPLTVCPECGGPLRKVFSPVGVMFKGPGFYVTDSRSKASSALATDTSHTPDKSHATGKSHAAGKKEEHADGGKKGEAKTAKADTAKPAPAAA